MKFLNDYIDHTLLHPAATPADIISLCDEAKKYRFYAVCVNSCYVYLAKKELKGSDVKIAATVGFPLGAAVTKAKVSEAKQCVKDGAHEIDMVINIGFLKAGLYKNVKEDIAAVKTEIGRRTLKVIIETCYLTEEEKRIACVMAKKAGADFVKTSTGFGTGGATFEDIKLMKDVVGDSMQIKASGGIATSEEAFNYIELGANRLGTSKGVELVLSAEENKL